MDAVAPFTMITAAATVFQATVIDPFEATLKPKSKQYYAEDISKNVISQGYVYNDKAINNSIENILLTLLGERLFNVGFGSILGVQVFSQLNFGQADALLNELVRVIGIWETRITIIEEDITLDINSDENSMIIIMPYRINRSGLTGTFSRKITL